jgi:hypothetical protein
VHFPNPTDVVTNPVRYWTDVALMQIEFGRQVYGMVASVNPYLPKDGYVIGAAELPVPVRRTKRTARRPMPRGATKGAATPIVAELPVSKSAVVKKTPVKKAATPVAKAVAKGAAKASAKPASKGELKVVAKAAPAVPAKAAPSPKRSRRPARKGVSLAPDLPPSKTTKTV